MNQFIDADATDDVTVRLKLKFFTVFIPSDKSAIFAIQKQVIENHLQKKSSSES